MRKEDSTPKPLSLKAVSVLDCIPGRADRPGDGEPMAILTIGSGGEVEQPLMLSLPDCHRLSRCLQEVLEHFCDEPSSSEDANGAPPTPEPPAEGIWPATGLLLCVRSRRPTRRLTCYQIVAAYRNRDTVMVYVRQGREFFIKITRAGRAKFRGLAKNEVYPEASIYSLRIMNGSTRFRIRGRIWTKLWIDDIRKIVSDQIFQV